MPDIANPAPTVCVNSTIPCAQSEWWQTVLTGPTNCGSGWRLR